MNSRIGRVGHQWTPSWLAARHFSRFDVATQRRGVLPPASPANRIADDGPRHDARLPAFQFSVALTLEPAIQPSHTPWAFHLGDTVRAPLLCSANLAGRIRFADALFYAVHVAQNADSIPVFMCRVVDHRRSADRQLLEVALTCLSDVLVRRRLTQRDILQLPGFGGCLPGLFHEVDDDLRLGQLLDAPQAARPQWQRLESQRPAGQVREASLDRLAKTPQLRPPPLRHPTMHEYPPRAVPAVAEALALFARHVQHPSPLRGQVVQEVVVVGRVASQHAEVRALPHRQACDQFRRDLLLVVVHGHDRPGDRDPPGIADHAELVALPLSGAGVPGCGVGVLFPRTDRQRLGVDEHERVARVPIPQQALDIVEQRPDFLSAEASAHGRSAGQHQQERGDHRDEAGGRPTGSGGREGLPRGGPARHGSRGGRRASWVAWAPADPQSRTMTGTVRVPYCCPFMLHNNSRGANCLWRKGLRHRRSTLNSLRNRVKSLSLGIASATSIRQKR